MTDAALWTLILGLGLATYLIRFSFIGLLAGRRLPPVVVEALGFVPVTVLPAIAARMVFWQDGAFTADPARMLAAAAGLAAGMWFRTVLAGVLGGLVTYMVLLRLGL